MPSPAQITWAKSRVIVVSVVAAGILGTLVYLLTGGSLVQQLAATYLYIPDATGLGEGSAVRVDGIDVGKVAEVALSGSNDPNRVVKVTMKVRRSQLPLIPIDSYAQISSESLIGDKFVDITSGTAAARIAAGAEIIYKNQPELLKTLDLAQFTAQLRKVDATLTDIEQGRNQFGQFMRGDSFYRDLMHRMTELQRGVATAINTTSTVGALLSTDKLHQQVLDFLSGLDLTLAKLQSGQGVAGRLLVDSAQYEQLVAAVHELQRFAERLGANEYLQSDRAYSSANRLIASLSQRVDEMNASPLVSTTVLYDNLNGAARELREAVRDFRQNPKKYLRLKVF
ncbi:MAG TPA: MlaD family protein [Bryobacteraceae bacterium]|nr:MlaD family protein [Bryobacteraceae bacterium]